MLGLYAFFYTLLHFVTYVWLDRELDMSTVLTDIVKRPYITVGFTAFVLLIPLAVTSTRGWIRRLGKRWVQLHKLVYIIATLGVLHYLWLVKADIREPVIYGAILMALLIIRAWNERRKRLST
jgi:sulfoxide reductase heme-binding subunit YedZ